TTKQAKTTTTMWLQKIAPTSSMFMTLNKGNNKRGNKDVTEMETASVIHQHTIHEPIAITVSAFSDNISKGKNCMIKNTSGPKKRPIFFEAGCFAMCIKVGLAILKLHISCIR